MANSNHVKNIAIVGATGQIGKFISAELIAAKKFNITAISRQDSPSKVPEGLIEKKGDYEDDNFFESALAGQDVLIMALSWMVPPNLQTRLIDAAAKAGVPWILSNEYGSDNAHPITNKTQINAGKAQYRQHVEDLGKSSWIGIVNNPWFEFSLAGGFFGIDINARTATIFDDGNTKFNVTVMPTVGLAVARLFQLPIESSDPKQASLSQFKNNFVYISSFLTTQNEMLDAVLEATGTTRDEWKIKTQSVQSYIDEGNERVKTGDFMGAAAVLYGTNMQVGSGGDYESTKGTSNAALRLPKEDLKEATKAVVESLASKK